MSVNKQKISLDDLIGQRYCASLKLHDNKLSAVDILPPSTQGIHIAIAMVTNICVGIGSDQSAGRDNRHISDDSSSQLLSQSDILSMRGCGIAGEVWSLLY